MPKRELRDVDGLLILDKPSGFTSNKCLQQVKHLLHAAKAGHTGALDPLASGVLPLCFGEATKVSQFLLDSDKAYRARIKLGVTTATGDSEGEVLATADVPHFSTAQIEAVCEAHGVPLRAAALQFPLAHPAVEIVMLGARQVAEWDDALAMLQHRIQPDFWAALREQGLLPAEAPTP